LKIDEKNLKVSIYTEDQEAYDIWVKDIKIPKDRIMKFGDEENFWPSEAKEKGPNGPCGPCSEIFYTARKGEPIEIWNMVFTQFNRMEGAVLEDLPNKNIDTGMGLERLASVMQGVDTNFEIDIFIPVVEAICKSLGYKKGGDPINDSNVNAIADHIRAAIFAVSDGVYPSNEERGFVIRKLIRKSTQRALQIKKDAKPFLYKIVPTVARVMKQQYPEIENKRETISQIIEAEEERFHNTITNTAPALRIEFISIKDSGKIKVPGDIVFRYSDEQGVPVDFQKEVAEELGLTLDMDAFNKLLQEQKKRSRAKSKISKDIFTAAPSGLARKKEKWDEESEKKIRMNHTATHLLHNALRQVAGEHAHQSGSLVYPERLRFDFTHPKKLTAEEIERVEQIVNKNIASGHDVERKAMKIEEAKRQGAIALFGEKYGAEVVVRSIGDFSKELCSGDHVDNTSQIRIFKIIQESSISAGTRRIEAVTGDEVYKWLSDQTTKLKTSINDTLKTLEKLDKKNNLSKKVKEKLLETDGWFNQKKSAELAYKDIEKWLSYEIGLSNLAEEINLEIKKAQKQLSKQQDKALEGLTGAIIEKAKEINGIKVISTIVNGMDMNSLRKLIDIIIGQAPDSAALLASETSGKVNLVLSIGKNLTKKGLNAKELIHPIAACVGGSGGGRADMAQAGGKDTAKIKAAIELMYTLIKEKRV
ncbi:MAG: hypothetical protein HQ547_07925, partial [Candidatus Omnitrophica bacterium]|nr:hypothetical protein [Candidatus Omnitrophota bacterium]